MKAPQEDPNNAAASPACAQCSQRLQPDETEGICSACLVMRALTPDPERGLPGNDCSRATTWAEEFPHLEIGQCLRKDGEVEILQARDLEDGSELWLLIPAEATVEKYGGLDSWERSYRALRQLNHPHLGRVLDFGELGARFFILLQAPQGRPLETLEGLLSLTALENLMVQVDDALASARAVGVSLSLRFTNVMVTDAQPENQLGHVTQQAVLIPNLKPTIVGLQSAAVSFSKPLCPHMVLGSYTLIDKIGEGGFAEVWLARQDEPVQRQVALKILKEGMDTQRILTRFEAERQALALLDHPYITRVHDAGSTDSGRPYFVMEAIVGQPIDTYCRETQAPLERRLCLLMRVCQAVQYAHHKAIIHRDLKPSNILVTADGEDSVVPKVIDFGIAKALDHSLTGRTVHTREHHYLGTPDYMSPEQMAGGRDVADSRSDVYALGVVLFELLTGTTPFNREPSKANVPFDVRSSDSLSYEAPKPSSRLDPARDTKKLPQGMPEPSLPRELDWIVLKALEHDPERRYQSPDQLGEDLRRFLDHEAVTAGPPTRLYRTGKFVRRHRAAVTGASVAIVALLLGSGLALAGWWKAKEERERVIVAQAETKREAEIATAVNSFLQNDLLGQADPHRSGKASDLTLRAALDRAASTVGDRFADKPEVLASLHFTLADTYLGLACLEEGEFHAREAARLIEELHGWDHHETLRANSQLARALSGRSRFEEALALHRRVLEGRRGLLGEEHVSTLRTWRHMAEIYRETGRHEQAEAALREIFATQERVLGARHSDSLSTLLALAVCLLDQGPSPRLDEAKVFARRVFETREEELGEDHLETLYALSILALTLLEEGEAEAAEPLHRRLLEKYRAIFGEKHDFTLTSMHNLAGNLGELGRYSEEVEILRELVPLRKELYGTGDVGTLASMKSYGVALLNLGQHAEARILLEEAFRFGSEVWDEKHPRLLTIQMFMADCHAKLGDVDKAVEIYARIVPASREAFGDADPRTITRGNNLAVYLGNIGRYDEAVHMWPEVVEGAEKAFGANDARLAGYLSEYGFALFQVGRFVESIPVLKRAETIYHEVLGADDPKTKDVRLKWLTSRRMAGEQMTQEEVEEAFRLFEEVNGRTMGEVHRETQMQAKEKKREAVDSDAK